MLSLTHLQGVSDVQPRKRDGALERPCQPRENRHGLQFLRICSRGTVESRLSDDFMLLLRTVEATFVDAATV